MKKLVLNIKAHGIIYFLVDTDCWLTDRVKTWGSIEFENDLSLEERHCGDVEEELSSWFYSMDDDGVVKGVDLNKLVHQVSDVLIELKKKKMNFEKMSVIASEDIWEKRFGAEKKKFSSKFEGVNDVKNSREHELFSEVFGIYRAIGKEFIRFRLWLNQYGKCFYTGEPIDLVGVMRSDDVVYTIDHILPLKRSKNDSFSNKILCPKDLNGDKGGKSPYEWMSGLKDRDSVKKRVSWEEFSERIKSDVKIDEEMKRKLLFQGSDFEQLNTTKIKVSKRVSIKKLTDEMLEQIKANPNYDHVYGEIKKWWDAGKPDTKELQPVSSGGAPIKKVSIVCWRWYENDTINYQICNDDFEIEESMSPSV